MGFLEKSTAHIVSVLRETLLSEDTSIRPGLLQRLDGWIKVVSFFILLLVAVLVRDLRALAGLYLFLLGLGWASHLPPGRMIRRAWILALPAALIALPALFLPPGDTGDAPIVLVLSQKPFIAITATGARTTLSLILRVVVSISLVLLLTMTTPWPDLLRALGSLGFPRVLLTLLAMTRRYVLLFFQKAEEMLLSRRSRLLGRLPTREGWRCLASMAGALLARTYQMSQEVYLAMEARGEGIGGDHRNMDPGMPPGANGRSPVEPNPRFAPTGEHGGLPLSGEHRGLPLSGKHGGLPLSGKHGGLPLSGKHGGLPLSGKHGGLPLSGKHGGLPLLALQGVRYIYPGGTVALDGVDLEVWPGEHVAVLGANGSGKSTLLKVMDGLYPPQEGEVRFLGRPVSPEDEALVYELHRRVGLIFQDPDIQLFSATVWDEVAFAPLQLGLSRAEVEARVERTLSWLGLLSLRNRPPYRLSDGEKRKVALASVLVYEPEVLLLDEPTNSLDPRSRAQLLDFLRKWGRGDAHTLVLCTHELALAREISRWVIVLNQGRVLAQGRPEEALSDGVLLREANLV